MGFKGDMLIMPLVVPHSIFHLLDYTKRTLVHNSALCHNTTKVTAKQLLEAEPGSKEKRPESPVRAVVSCKLTQLIDILSSSVIDFGHVFPKTR